MAPLIFISHSSNDSHTADAIVRLLRLALNLSPGEIRCTSVDGYRLPAGSDTDEQLRAELLGAQVLIGILSPQGMSSAYVLFELGARWGAQKPLVPLLAPGVGPEILKGPVSGLNALRADSESQLYQLISDLALCLDLPANPPASYVAELKSIASAPAIMSSTVGQPQDQAQPDFTVDQLALIHVLAQTDKHALSLSELQSALGWKKIKTEHHISALQNLKYIDYLDSSAPGRGRIYWLNQKGKALAVTRGLAD